MIRVGKIGLLLLLSITIVAGFLWLPPAAGFPNPELARMVVFHVPCSIVGLLATLVGTWYAVMYLWKRRPIDDVKSYTSFMFALLCWTLTTVTGAIFAKSEWGTYWNWDIKQTSILMLLLVFVAYFALRAAIDDARKGAVIGAVYTMFALLAVPYLTLILPNSTPSTLHPKNTQFSAVYWCVLLADAIGFSLVYFWAFRLHVALDTVALRMQNLRKRTVAPVAARRVVRQGN